MTIWYSEEEDQKTRDALLRYYSSECTVHGSYIITLGIGFFGFLQVVTFIQRNVVYPDIILSLILSTFASIGIYLVVRTIFWGTIASYVLHVREISPEEVEIDSKRDRDTLFLRLHRACLKYFKTYHSKLNWFVGVEKGNSDNLLLYGLIIVVLTVVLRFMLFHY